MNVLKAYADAGALGQQSYGRIVPKAGGGARTASQKGRSGDFISISEEAMEMLASGGQNSLSVMPQDATYDQNGHVTRQLDSLESELRHLAGQFIGQPGTASLMPHLGAMQSRLASIRTQV